MGCFSTKCHSDKSKHNNNENSGIKIKPDDKISAKIAIAKNTLNYNFDNMKLNNLDFIDKIQINNNALKNNINTQQFESFSKNIVVKVFSANNNHIKNIPREFFKRVSKITKIDFSYNEFQEIDEVLCALKTLKILIFNNNLISFIPKNFNELTNLKELKLSHNQLNEIEVEDKIREMENLELLDLSQNKIRSFPIKILLNKKLIDLKLSNNLIEIKISNEHWSNSNLKNLDLSYNFITANNLSEEIFNASRVSNFNLKGNKITLEELKHIKGFENFVERRKQRKDQGFMHNLAINFDFCGLD